MNETDFASPDRVWAGIVRARLGWGFPDATLKIQGGGNAAEFVFLDWRKHIQEGGGELSPAGIDAVFRQFLPQTSDRFTLPTMTLILLWIPLSHGAGSSEDCESISRFILSELGCSRRFPRNRIEFFDAVKKSMDDSLRGWLRERLLKNDRDNAAAMLTYRSQVLRIRGLAERIS